MVQVFILENMRLRLFVKVYYCLIKLKKKIPTTRKGPSPKWDIPLRWENINRDDFKTITIEISLWNQERFRKTMIGFVRLNSAKARMDKKTANVLGTTAGEKAAWELFQQKPTKTRHSGSKISVFSPPKSKIQIQKMQMQMQKGQNPY